MHSMHSYFNVKPNLGYVRLSCGLVGALTILAHPYSTRQGTAIITKISKQFIFCRITLHCKLCYFTECIIIITHQMAGS